MNLDDAVVVAMATYTENEWRTSESAMRAALAAAAPLILAEARGRGTTDDDDDEAAKILANVQAQNVRLRANVDRLLECVT